MEFDDSTQRFEEGGHLPVGRPRPARRAPVLEGGRRWRGVSSILPEPYPLVRVKADPESLARVRTGTEAYTCLVKGSRLDSSDLKIDRAEDGTARYTWKTDTPALYAGDQAKLVQKKILKPEEVLFALQDADTGKGGGGRSPPTEGRFTGTNTSSRWVMIVSEIGGTSFLGEVWLGHGRLTTAALGLRPQGRHPRQLHVLQPQATSRCWTRRGKRIFFEAAYTHTFSDNKDATPRYDYNQVMYQLDLSIPELNLPVAFYRRRGDRPGQPRNQGEQGAGGPVAFFRSGAARNETVPVFLSNAGGQPSSSSARRTRKQRRYAYLLRIAGRCRESTGDDGAAVQTQESRRQDAISIPQRTPGPTLVIAGPRPRSAGSGGVPRVTRIEGE